MEPCGHMGESTPDEESANILRPACACRGHIGQREEEEEVRSEVRQDWIDPWGPNGGLIRKSQLSF